MESSKALKPSISILVPALLGYDTIAAALDSWERQSARDQLEILVLCPSAPGHPVPEWQTIVEVGSLMLHQARALGVREASADYVMFAEDHCLPDPDCAQALVERLQGPWDAVGTALRCGNPQWTGTQGAFLISYGQWMLPVSGAISYLPGHNVAVRKELLLAMGPELEEELVFSSFLMLRLRSERRIFFLDEKARMRHFDAPAFKWASRIFYTVGKGCGAVRLKRSGMIVRMLYPPLIPAIAARHFIRGLIHYFRAGPRAGFGIGSIAAAAIFASIWAWGEVVGALSGLARVTPTLWIGEIKPVSPEQARQ